MQKKKRFQKGGGEKKRPNEGEKEGRIFHGRMVSLIQRG